MAHALMKVYCTEALGTKLNPDTIYGIRMDWRIRFEYATCGRENLSIRKEKVADSKLSGF